MTHSPQNPQGSPQGQQTGYPQQTPPQQPPGDPSQTQGHGFPGQGAPGQGSPAQQHGAWPGNQPGGYPQQGQPAQPAGYPQQGQTTGYPQQGQTGGAYSQPQQGYGQPGYGAPAQPRPNPFAGTPVSDWIRDAVAVVLLLVSLALPWAMVIKGASSDTGLMTAASRVEVLLITLLSAISVSVGYLARAGVFGQNFTPARAALTRALLNLPYLLLVLLYIVFDTVKFTDYGNGSGLGAAAGVGLAGALFAAVPRRYELQTPQLAGGAAKLSYNSLVGYSVATAAATLLGLVMSIIAIAEFAGSGFGDYLGLAVFSGLALGIVVALAVPAILLFVLRRSETARLIAVGFGIAAILALFINAFSKLGVIESVWSSFGYPLLLLAASTALVSSSGLPYAMKQQPALNSWYGVARLAPLASIIGAGIVVVWAILRIIASEGREIGLVVGVLICAVLSIVAALILRMQIISNFQQSRVIAGSIAGGIAVLGLVSTILAGLDAKQGFGMLVIDVGWVLVIFFAPAALVIYALFVPAAVRSYFASFAPQHETAQYGQGFPQQGGPGQYGAQQGQPSSGQPDASGQFQTGQYDPAQFSAQQNATGEYDPSRFGQPAGEAAGQLGGQPSGQPATQQETGQVPPVPQPSSIPESHEAGSAQQAAEQPAQTRQVPQTPQTPTQQSSDTPPVPAPPVPPVPAPSQPAQPSAPRVPAEAARAADPGTPATELHAMSQERELWPYLAANPSLYPALEQWLASTGDPETLEALAKRKAGDAGSNTTPVENGRSGDEPATGTPATAESADGSDTDARSDDKPVD